MKTLLEKLENLNLVVNFCTCSVCTTVNLCMYYITVLNLSLSLSIRYLHSDPSVNMSVIIIYAKII